MSLQLFDFEIVGPPTITSVDDAVKYIRPMLAPEAHVRIVSTEFKHLSGGLGRLSEVMNVLIKGKVWTE